MNVPAPADENGTPDPNKPTDAEIEAAFRRAFLEIYGMTPKRLMTMIGIDEIPPGPGPRPAPTPEPSP